MRKKMVLLIATFIMLAICIPAVMAAEYPQNGQFIAYYDEDKLVKDSSPSKDAGTTYYNAGENAEEKAATLVRTITRTDPGDDWPQFHRYVKNAGNSPCTGLPQSNPTVYDFDDREVIGTINPVIENGKILVLTGYAGFDEPQALTEINLTCIHENNMTVAWDFALPRNVHYGSWSSPATDGTYAYASSDNKTYCVDLATGAEAWNFTTLKATSCNGGPTIGGNYVFCSDWDSSNCNYYCLNKSTGALKWIFNDTCTSKDSGYFQATPAYESAGGNEYVYLTGWGYDNVSRQAGYLYKVNAATGAEVWSVEESGKGAFCGSPALDGSNVYVTSYDFSNDGYLFKFSKSRGTLLVSVQIERSDATPAIDETNSLIYVSGGWNGGNWGSTPPGVRCFYTNNLTQKWGRINESMGGWTCSVSIGDGLAFVGKESGDMNSFCYNTTYALNALTGETKWSYPQGGATAAIANDKVYTVGNNGHLYRFS